MIISLGYQRFTNFFEFIRFLKPYKINMLYDLRSIPYSKNYLFNKELLKEKLAEEGIEYHWCIELGGKYIHTKTQRLAVIKKMPVEGNNIAIMCMENSINACHRKEINVLIKEQWGIEVNEVTSKLKIKTDKPKQEQLSLF